MKRFKFTIYCISVLVFLSCNNTPSKQTIDLLTGKALHLKYATGFKATDYGDYVALEVLKPWPNAKKTYKYAIIRSKSNRNWAIEKSRFDGVIHTDINKIVVTSTTHIPALELLGVTNRLVGFPGTDYISSEHVRERIDKGFVKDIGKNETINTEVLLELNPQVVIGFGIEGANKTFETIKNAGIPVIYNGDWAESSALAKAEWLKFFGVLFNKEHIADSIFNTIEKDYIQAKAIALKAKNIPRVLSGAMYKDVWYLPNGNSPEAQFLKDANTNYLWQSTAGNGSLALSFESVLENAQDADLWLNPSYYANLEQLQKANPLYANFKAFNTKSIFSFVNVTGKTGGVLYYEMGTARPDIVLKDLIKICHPELLSDYTPYFFKRLK